MQWLHENCIHVKKPPNLLKIARFGGYIYLYNHVTSDKFINLSRGYRKLFGQLPVGNGIA